MTKIFTAYIEYDADTKLYVGIIPAIRGVHTQGATLDELQQNLKEVLELCLEESQEDLSHYLNLSVFNKLRWLHESLTYC